MLQYLATFSRETNKPTWGTAPLVSRFPLSKLAQVVPNPGNAAAVKADFGLVWNSDHWEYWGSNGTAEQSTIPAITGAATDFFNYSAMGGLIPR